MKNPIANWKDLFAASTRAGFWQGAAVLVLVILTVLDLKYNCYPYI
ncbi:MAG TPA: hypothetical protein P5246_00290 [Candidatus Omnitrophota bacterium]|nr:hypothetical protein [Candidatus Omnitrophota bacterium]HSA31655.1 hypothetical protein [Candidatus Omnitrophota bacterium]